MCVKIYTFSAELSKLLRNFCSRYSAQIYGPISGVRRRQNTTTNPLFPFAENCQKAPLLTAGKMQMIRFISTPQPLLLGLFWELSFFSQVFFSHCFQTLWIHVHLRFKFQELFEVESFVFPCAINKLFLGCAFSQKAKKSLKIVKLHE